MKAVFAAVVMIAASSIPAFADCPAADRKMLEEFDRAWGNAGERGDRAHLQGVFADDFSGLSPAGLVGKTETIDLAVRDFERTRTSGRPAPTVVHDYYLIGCTPNTATITHRNVVTNTVDGKPTTLYTRSVHFLEKRANRWVVVSNAGHPLSDGAILLYMEHEWNDADLKRDVTWHERSYSDEFSGISSRNGARRTKTEDIASVSKGGLDFAELSDLEVRVEGNTGVVTGANHVKGKDDKGVAFDRNVRFTDTFVKRDGRWLVLASQGTDIK